MPKVPLLLLGVMIITIGSTAFAINNWDSIIEHGGSIISHIIKALMCLLCFLYKVFPPSMALLYTLWEYFVILALNYITSSSLPYIISSISSAEIRGWVTAGNHFPGCTDHQIYQKVAHALTRMKDAQEITKHQPRLGLGEKNCTWEL